MGGGGGGPGRDVAAAVAPQRRGGVPEETGPKPGAEGVAAGRHLRLGAAARVQRRLHQAQVVRASTWPKGGGERARVEQEDPTTSHAHRRSPETRPLVTLRHSVCVRVFLSA